MTLGVKFSWNTLGLYCDKKPLFLAENVSGMLSSTHAKSLEFLISEFHKLGYNFTYKLLNAYDYGVPEDRKRVFFIGYHKKLGKGIRISRVCT